MFAGLGIYELAVIFAIGVIIFGPSRIPKIGKALGETFREMRGIGREIERGQDEA